MCIHQCNALLLSLSQGIPKLDDANEAGGRHSHDCTLILTEGDSAKTLAVSGLGVVGRDHYGVFPLRGKLLNVREASHNQVTLWLLLSLGCVHVCVMSALLIVELRQHSLHNHTTHAHIHYIVHIQSYTRSHTLYASV